MCNGRRLVHCLLGQFELTAFDQRLGFDYRQIIRKSVTGMNDEGIPAAFDTDPTQGGKFIKDGRRKGVEHAAFSAIVDEFLMEMAEEFGRMHFYLIRHLVRKTAGERLIPPLNAKKPPPEQKFPLGQFLTP